MQLLKAPLEDAPGPSPWFLLPEVRPVTGFVWQSAGDTALSSGKTLLVGADGPVAIFNFYNYVMPLDDCSLLVWHQKWTEAPPTEPVRLLIIRPDRLPPLGSDVDTLLEQMNRDTPLLTHGETCAELALCTDNATGEIRVEFPKQLRSVGELLILCHSSGIEMPGPGGSNLALLVARPGKSTYRLYPQDWFNAGGLDYGYQWVTRVARHPLTRRIHGDGIRIGPFVLDGSLRRLR